MIDPVQTSNTTTHPVDFLSTYKDKVTGFTGKATAVLYNGGNHVVVSLTTTRDGKPVQQYIRLGRLVPVNGARIDYHHQAKLPITFYEDYQDDVTGYIGKAVGIIFSSSKCVQVFLAKGTENSVEEEIFDIGNLSPVSKDVPAHALTHDTNPGAPRGISSNISAALRDY